MFNNFLTAAGGTGSGLFSIVLIVVMFVVFYFFIIRPQKKQEKHQEGRAVKATRSANALQSTGDM